MFIDRNIKKYVVFEEESIINTLRKIDDKHGRIVFIVSERDILKGVATNGDILRWLIKNDAPDLNRSITDVANTNYLSVEEDYSQEELKGMLGKVLFVPIVNKQNCLTGVACRKQPDEGFSFNNIIISKDSPAFIIAEIGNNHNGSIKLAKKLIDKCVDAGADCAKFQMRNMESLYQNAGDADDIKENLGSQYTLDLLSRFQLSDEELFEVFDYCKSVGIQPLCTPWDGESLKKLETYGMPAYKVASADFTNHELLKLIAKTGKLMICSIGMSTEDEIDESVDLLKSLGAPFILLHCNSTYPAPFKDINLKYIERAREKHNVLVGYSGHERGIAISIAAAALGSKVIERHITLDRSMEGNDHKASLLPGEFKEMIQGIREVEEGLGEKTERKISQGEMMNRVTLAKSLIINQDLNKGETITKTMIDIKSPGKGLQPNYLKDLVGQKAKKDFCEGDFFYPSDIQDVVVERKEYKFNRPWGVPVRYHDFKEMIQGTNPDLIEFHLSYKDMEIDFNQFFDSPVDMDFVVHSPELFAGDHTLDLCTDDEDYRSHSIAELQKVINLTNELKKYFTRCGKVLIVTNVGGFTDEGFLSAEERQNRMKILEDSLAKLDMSGIEIIPQTMPPFPWHFGGQQYHNLFVDSDEIVSFCKRNDVRICLDTSHSKLACTHYKWSFYEFLEKTGPYTAHIHFADSENTGGEGIQIGEGEIDLTAMAYALNEKAPNASFIPEIWQGHENNGEGFWIALERLEEVLS